MIGALIIVSCFVLGASSFCFASAKQYDGVWFLGFNLKKDIFSGDNGKLVRQAVTMAVDRTRIATKIVGDDTVPVNIIPPGMEGYLSLESYPHDYRQAKTIMKRAGYTIADKRLKAITLLHTDGEKTKQIVDEIKIDLINLGFDITTTQLSYSDTKTWQKELASGKYDLFVMGYKAGSVGEIFVGDKATNLFHTFTCFENTTIEADIVYFNHYDEAIKAGFTPDTVCKPQPEVVPGTIDLIKPLLYTEGEANMMRFSSKRVDILLEELSGLDPAMKASRSDRFEEISRIVWEECPVVPLFYITRL
jgi:ABC-type transport system substrate-binding protein